MENTNQPEKKEGSKRGLVMIIIVLLLATNGLLLWQFFNKNSEITSLTKTKEELTTEKAKLTADIEKARAELQKLMAENSSMKDQLSAKDAELQEALAKIDKLIRSGDAAQLRRAKGELAALREKLKTYEFTIDSLNKVNLALNQQNQTLTTDLGQQKMVNDTLSQSNVKLANKVAIGSVLKADKVTAIGVKFKSSGKELPTTKAKSVQKMKTCFTIQENRVVDAGNVELYIRILGHDGSCLATGTETFMYNGQPTIYTVKQEMMYENKNTDLCVYWAKGSEFAKGTYTIEIYANGNQIGTGKTILK